MVYLQKAHIRVLLTYIRIIDCHDVLMICILQWFEEWRNLKAKFGIALLIYTHRKIPKACWDKTSHSKHDAKIGALDLPKFWELEFINRPNFQWLSLNFWTFRVFMTFATTSESCSFREAGTFFFFLNSKTSLHEK